MTKHVLLCAAVACLLAGCAADLQKPAVSEAQASYTPIGTNIPRKSSSGPTDNTGNADLQQLENARNSGSGIINGPGSK